MPYSDIVAGNLAEYSASCDNCQMFAEHYDYGASAYFLGEIDVSFSPLSTRAEVLEEARFIWSTERGRAFTRQCLADISDHSIFADWCQENNLPKHEEWAKKQIELLQTGTTGKGSNERHR